MSYAFDKLSVLIVDDHAPVRDLLTRLLTVMGVGRILSADNADDAYQTALREQPDIILTDWEMAGSSGLDLTRWIRDNATSPIRTTPVILMTGYTAPHRIAEARDTGITEFLTMPFSAAELARGIAYVIEHPRDFIETQNFFGPDRRRVIQSFKGPDRRATTANGAGGKP